jgi:L-amino acid N-acyltransferase YncA
MPTIEELLALDILTLRAHTERAGDELNVDRHRAGLVKSLAVSQVCAVRREGVLVAYAMLQPESPSCWFVTGFNTHPLHRTASVLFELLASFAGMVHKLGIAELRSNVYKTNELSMAFHRRLGFKVTKENAKGVEFFASVADVLASSSIARTLGRLTDPMT